MTSRVIACLIALGIGLCAASQVFAYLAKLDPALGVPWYQDGWVAFYAPWAILGWYRRWGHIPHIGWRLAALAGVLAGGGCLWQIWPSAQDGGHEAHWATTAELQKAQLLPRWRMRWPWSR